MNIETTHPNLHQAMNQMKITPALSLHAHLYLIHFTTMKIDGQKTEMQMIFSETPIQVITGIPHQIPTYFQQQCAHHVKFFSPDTNFLAN